MKTQTIITLVVIGVVVFGAYQYFKPSTTAISKSGTEDDAKKEDTSECGGCNA